ncbi:uncharacterized protein MONBRDRAFT_32391 [Monosiga brevicollis MX1]|uniref:Amino acid transporter transmembrane domain-containing protein n=1 Tax=Monosiga brevicollis TaxID=81824 RepID=A9UZ83_MONBE|nr:uncharacterized protein MONBRDRAFT_32391 [Monosiga brevicollis MX1]EDQ89189.1 predicted protein [Monosiga brevicollis MX1]|eukprot:XP_001745765.1 hypothetical protein [Monosiga brevicollis MX1]
MTFGSFELDVVTHDRERECVRECVTAVREKNKRIENRERERTKEMTITKEKNKRNKNLFSLSLSLSLSLSCAGPSRMSGSRASNLDTLQQFSDDEEDTPLLLKSSGSADSRRPFTYQPIRDASAAKDPNNSNSHAYQRYRYYNKLAPANQPNSLIMPHHALPSSVFVLGKGGEQSSVVTILSMWNTMMGSSVLTMPWAIDQAGFGLGIFAMILMATVSYYTCTIVLSAGQGGRINGEDVEFAEVVLRFLGKRYYVVAVIFSVLTIVGAAIAYWVLMSGFLYTVVDYFHDPSGSIPANSTHPSNHTAVLADALLGASDGTDSTWGHYWSRELVPIYLIAILFPLINFKSLTFFTKFNSLGVVSIIYILFFVLFTFFDGEHYQNSPAGGVHFHNVEEWRSGVMALCGVSSLAFFIHNGCLSIMRNAAEPKHNQRDLLLAYILVCLTYLLVGVLYYISYAGNKDGINNNFLQDFHKTDKNFIFSLIAQLCLLLQMITVFPLLIFIVRFQVMSTFFNGNVWPSFGHVLGLNVMITTVCVLVAIFYPHIGDILRYTGAICGCVYIFALPCLVQMEILRRQNKLTVSKRVIHYLLMLLGVGILVGQFTP